MKDNWIDLKKLKSEWKLLVVIYLIFALITLIRLLFEAEITQSEWILMILLPPMTTIINKQKLNSYLNKIELGRKRKEIEDLKSDETRIQREIQQLERSIEEKK